MALSKIDLDKAGVTGTLPTANLDTVGVAQGGTGITSGTTDQFLKFTGTTTLASAADNAGALNFITEVSSSSTHNGIVIDNCFTSTYENYLIIGDISVTNSGDTIRARMKSSSATLDGSQYTYRFQRYEADSNTQGNDTRATGETYFQLTEGLNDNSARVSYTFKMTIFDPVSASKRMGLRQESIAVSTGAVLQSIDGAGQYKDQTSIVGIAFYPSANNFSNSTIRIYGISNS